MPRPPHLTDEVAVAKRRRLDEDNAAPNIGWNAAGCRSDDEEDIQLPRVQEVVHVAVHVEADLRAKFNPAWRRLRQLCRATQWHEEVKQHNGTTLSAIPDIMELLRVDIAPMYQHISESTDPDIAMFAAMAASSCGQLSANLAECFCERCLLVGNMVNDGKALLSDEEVEMLVVLCINMEFMEFMRVHHVAVAVPQYNMTVVDA